jgi:hypothetical protein
MHDDHDHDVPFGDETPSIEPFLTDDYTIFFPRLREQHFRTDGRLYRGHRGKQLECATCTKDAWEALVILARTVRGLGYDRIQALAFIKATPVALRSHLSSGQREGETHRYTPGKGETAKKINPQAQPLATARNSLQYRKAFTEAIEAGRLGGTLQDNIRLLGWIIRVAQSQNGSIAMGQELPFRYLGEHFAMSAEAVADRWEQMKAACAAYGPADRLLTKHVFRWTERGARQVVAPMVNDEGDEEDRLLLVSNEQGLNGGRDVYTALHDRVIDQVQQVCIEARILDLPEIENRLRAGLAAVGVSERPAKLAAMAKALFATINEGVAKLESEAWAVEQVRKDGFIEREAIVVHLTEYFGRTDSQPRGDAGAWYELQAHRIHRKVS